MREGRKPILACGPFLCLLLISCGNSSELSREDGQNLDDAAQMLDEAANMLSNIDENALGEPEKNLPEPAADEPA